MFPKAGTNSYLTAPSSRLNYKSKSPLYQDSPSKGSISGAMKISKQLATFLLLNQKMKVKVVNSAAKGD